MVSSPGPKRNKAYGVLGAGQPLGFILGLILGKFGRASVDAVLILNTIGGVLTQSGATWRAVFYMQSGLGVLFVILGFVFLVKQPRSPARRYTKGLDWGGALLSAAGIGLLTYSLA